MKYRLDCENVSMTYIDLTYSDDLWHKSLDGRRSLHKLATRIDLKPDKRKDYFCKIMFSSPLRNKTYSLTFEELDYLHNVIGAITFDEIMTDYPLWTIADSKHKFVFTIEKTDCKQLYDLIQEFMEDNRPAAEEPAA